MAQERIALYSTKRLEVELRKDGVPWDLSTASATLYLTHPNGTRTTHVGSIDSPATDGVAYFECEDDTLDEAGVWWRHWKIVDGTVEEYTDPVLFVVFDPRKG